MKQTIRDKVFDQIIHQAASGCNIMLCAPKRSGKTELLVRLFSEVEVFLNKKVFYLSLQNAQRQELSRRLGYNIDGCTFKNFNCLYGKDIDCVVIEEPYKVDPLLFNRAIDNVNSRARQVIFVFSPFEYDSKNPHPLKILWDTAPYFKYQISAGTLDWYNDISKSRSSFCENDFQTEIEGNWVAI